MKKKLAFSLALTLVFLLTNCVAVAHSAEAGGAKLGKGNEILVVEDLGGGLPVSPSRWCGNSALLLYGDGIGIEWVDLSGKRVTVSKESDDYPRGCSPDGKWVLYEDRDSTRAYVDKLGRVQEIIYEDGPGWHGYVMDMYRYEIETGTRQKFAVVRDDSGPLVSPDGSKVFLGIIHDAVIEMPEPGWETVWLTNEWVYMHPRWFEDSSGIVTTIWDNGDSLGVEFFGVGGWAKEFNLDQSVCFREAGCAVSIEAVDTEGGIYLRKSESFLVDRYVRYRRLYYRCEVEDRELLCEKAGELKEEGNSFPFVALLPDGDIIFNRSRDNCVRRIKQGQTDVECIANTRYGKDIYEEVYAIALSPDGRRLAFSRSKEPTKPGERAYGYQYDLFVKELEDD